MSKELDDLYNQKLCGVVPDRPWPKPKAQPPNFRPDDLPGVGVDRIKHILNETDCDDGQFLEIMDIIRKLVAQGRGRD